MASGWHTGNIRLHAAKENCKRSTKNNQTNENQKLKGKERKKNKEERKKTTVLRHWRATKVVRTWGATFLGKREERWSKLHIWSYFVPLGRLPIHSMRHRSRTENSSLEQCCPIVSHIILNDLVTPFKQVKGNRQH